MENTLKVYLDSVTSFNSFLELGSKVDEIHNTVTDKFQEFYSFEETRLSLNELMKKLKSKYN